MFRSLRFKIAMAIILINTLSFVLMSAINFETSNKQMNDQLIHHSLASLRSTAANLDSMIALRVKEAEWIAQSSLPETANVQEKLGVLAHTAIRMNLPVRRIGIAGSAGDMALRDGSSLDVSGYSAFRKALNDGVTASEMKLEEDGYPVLWLMIPEPRTEGSSPRIIGFALDSPLLFRNQLTERMDEFEDSAILVIDRDTNLLYHDDTSLILRRNYVRDEPALSDFAARMRTSEEGFGASLAFGRVLKLFYAKIPGQDWYAVYYIAESEFAAPMKRSLWINMSLIALTELVLGLFLYFVTHHSILRRLKQVVEVTRNVAAGNFYPRPLQIRSGDEMGMLADSVNGMIDNLQELFEPFQAFIRHNQYAMIVTDSRFAITSFNKRAEEMLGYKESETVGRNCLLLWHDEDQLRERARYYSDKLNREIVPDESLLFLPSAKGFLPDWEWTWIDRAGARLLVSLNTSVIRNPDGSTKGYVLIARDISEIKQAVATNARLHEILERAHDMIASFDTRGRIFYLNQAGHAFLGIEELNAENNKLNRYMPVPTTVTFADGLAKAQQEGYWQSEIDFIGQGGSVRMASITVVAHRTNDGRDVFYSTIVRDISHLKEIQSQLLSAKVEADLASEAKSSFLARMSHEIRTPLNGIIGLTHLLQKSELTDIQADYLRQVADSSHNLLRILNDILDFSKLEADMLTLEQAPFRLEEVLQRLSGMFSVLLGPKPVDFNLYADPAIPDWLIGDPTRLQQILLNLGSNAIKFTNFGLIELTIMLAELDDRSARLAFLVKDTGIGMTEAQKARLFEPFVQADEKTSRKYGGTGLGLVISHTLVERMGGTIEVDSDYGAGSAFRFELSFAVGANKPGADLPVFPGLKVLVLEDQPKVAEHWRRLLTSFGCEAVALSSWRQAELLLKESDWDLMIVDMETGDMHGEETWKAWRTKLEDAGVRVIASTTLLGRDALYQLADEHKPHAVLVKPSSSLQVRQVLHSIVDASKKPPRPEPPLSESRSATRPDPGRSKIWVVDDQIINRLVVKQMLGAQGYEVELLESGAEAVERSASGPADVDLILMDVHMPDMDGIEATIRIRRAFDAERLPIVALTADVTESIHRKCREAGMNDILTKPVNPELLFGVLDVWLHDLPLSRLVRRPEPRGEAESDAAWTDLPGLSAPAALQRLGGKSGLYLLLLDKFRQQYASVPEQLPAIVREGRLEEAARLVHSLGGAAGHLGAETIRETAVAMEAALRGEAGIREAEEKLLEALEEAMENIAILLERKRS
ncbi:response regulator [Paenibacillaceae bacterium WGS1546]|uniref:response regulator n=1 Tax=Cohnella sp. WGS1546 TaxID=3366810 RepID=UPI00372CFB88